MSITVGTWAFPLLVSLAVLSWVAVGDYSPRGDYDFGTPLIGLLKLCGAVIASLVAWLLWAVLS